jgi:hypothetical protein
VSKNQAPQLDTGVLAVLHRVGGNWRMLIASARNGRASVLEAGEFPADNAGEIEAHLAANRVGRVICVLPAASVICRTATLPNAEPEQLQQALRLQAEAHLPADAPPHRTAMTVLPAAPGETSRTGIILTWPQAASVGAPPITGRPVTYVPTVAALAALLDGLRPADPLLWLDRADGSLALAITHANGAMFRTTREEATSTEDWKRRVTSVLAETALNAGHTGPFVDALVQREAQAIASVDLDGALLVMPPEITDAARAQLDGTRGDGTWWSTYGIAAGVLLAATGEFAPLTTLLDAPAVEKPSPFLKAGEALSRPRTAMITVIVCLLILGLAPVAASGLRLGILRLRHPHIEEQVREVEQRQEALAMYAALEEQAWCSSKLLADIVCNTPEGIELEEIRLQRSNNSFSVRGEAQPRRDRSAKEVVALMQEQLLASRIFDKIDLTWGDPNNYGYYQFDLSAKIESPHRRQRYETGGDLDYENWPLADRQRGAGPRVAEAPPAREEEPQQVAAGPPPADEGESESSPSGRSLRPPRTTGPDTLLQSEVRGTEAGLPDRLDIPEPLTEEQINAMTIAEVRGHLTKVARAKEYARKSKDDELFERLDNEFQQMMARLKERD